MPTDIKGNQNIIAGQLHLHDDSKIRHQVQQRLNNNNATLTRRATACIALAMAAGATASLIGASDTVAAVVTTVLLLPVSVSLMLWG
jgi:hypothetical protein